VNRRTSSSGDGGAGDTSTGLGDKRGERERTGGGRWTGVNWLVPRRVGVTCRQNGAIIRARLVFVGLNVGQPSEHKLHSYAMIFWSKKGR
jgi:hypothetical protein